MATTIKGKLKMPGLALDGQPVELIKVASNGLHVVRLDLTAPKFKGYERGQIMQVGTDEFVEDSASGSHDTGPAGGGRRTGGNPPGADEEQRPV